MRSDPRREAAQASPEALAEQVAEALRATSDAAHVLQGAPGPKALLRRFGELLGKSFGVASFEAARLSGKRGKVVLKRRGVQADGIAPLADETLAKLSTLLAGGLAAAELGDGITDLDADGAKLSVAVVEDARTAKGTLVAWTPPPGSEPLARVRLEALVRVLQNEARWLRKLDRTQALLYRDDLTGLYNSRYLEISLDAELRRAERFGSQFCLMFLDLDGFKPINDNHGHLSGSSVLKQVAEVLRDAVREVDIPIRYGGDEFVVVLLGATCAKGLLAAERVRRRIEAKEFKLEGGGPARLTASIGVAAFPEHGRDRNTLLKMADETMYDSKRAGKNRVSVVSRNAPRSG